MCGRLQDVRAAEWDALSRDGTPFLSHAFLSGLEETGCVGGETGWSPSHVLLHDAKGLAAAAPAYLKDHSYGEFVFDFAWAQAYMRAGRSYYPKLIVGVPFTPATGPRLLVRPGLDERAWAGELIGALSKVAADRTLSSVHALFTSAADAAHFETAGWLLRRDCQFHWSNRGYRDFDDYLASFTAEKRKKAKRERRRVAEMGIVFETWHGSELDEKQLDRVHALHRETFLRHGHDPYLNREFFGLAASTLGRQFMVKAATWQGEWVACAVYFRSASTLYGRYWGSVADFHSLHFETCYHQGIDYCISEGLASFEPGTQGEHKVARGFEPTVTHSAHLIRDPRFRDAIEDYLVREGAAVDAYSDEIRTHVPFRR